MSNCYWDGTELVKLDASKISAPWGQAGHVDGHVDGRIIFANEIFKLWFDARGNINACPNRAHQDAMTHELQDAGRSGRGVFTIDDLEEAFDHISDNSGRWTDDTHSYTYQGNPNNVFRQGGLIRGIPAPFTNFANAVDSKFQKVRECFRNFDQQTQIIGTQMAARTTDWDRVGTALAEIERWGQQVKPFLWARPPVSRAVGKTNTFVGVLSNVHSGVNTYLAARQENFPDGQAAAIGVLRSAVGFVPVLGSYYGAMVDLMPTLSRWYTKLSEQNVRKIDRAGSTATRQGSIRY